MKFLLISISVSVLALAFCLCSFVLTLRSTVADLPGELADTRSELLHQVEALRISALAEIDKQASGLRHDANAQLTVIRKDAVAELDRTRLMADSQLTGARADLRHTVTESVAAVIAPLEGLRLDLQPVIANAAALTKDAQDSLDDIYPDARNLVESAEVATTQVAQTAEVIRATAPQFLATSQESNKQLGGVVTDVHSFTTEFTRKRTLKEKLWSGFKAVALVASRF